MSDDSLRDVKAVFFDLDETLIDAPRGLEASHEAVAEKLCDYFFVSDSEINQKEISRKLSDFDDRMNLKRFYNRDLWWPEFISELDIDREFDSSQIEDLSRTYWKTYIEAAVPYPDSKSILEYLSEEGYRLGLVTDTDGSEVSKRKRISEYDFSDYFEVIVIGGEDTPGTKPHSEPFELAASKLSLSPEECVMVGDKPFTDIKGANSVGMVTILVKRRDWGVEEDPDFTIERLGDLKDLL